MKTTVALILLIGGTLVMVGGFAWAVWAFAQMYGTAMDDPMNGQIDGKKTSTEMLIAVGVGMLGFIPATAGSIMVGKGIIGRLVKRFSKEPAPFRPKA
ncbi:MAG: hypothetical protein Q8L55_01900 [Phycisphaerales bacterium]|nr:hypothetical protein [Phycisphaerales bacterium]